MSLHRGIQVSTGRQLDESNVNLETLFCPVSICTFLSAWGTYFVGCSQHFMHICHTHYSTLRNVHYRKRRRKYLNCYSYCVWSPGNVTISTVNRFKQQTNCVNKMLRLSSSHDTKTYDQSTPRTYFAVTSWPTMTVERVDRHAEIHRPQISS